MVTAQEILDAKHAAGDGAHLWLQPLAGDVILWPDEAASIGDDGARAIGRWQVTPEVENALIDSGEVDEIN